jgi:Icc-related predicted phosphoesterase
MNMQQGASVRVLAIADIHGMIEVYGWLRHAVSDYHADVLILAGDLLIGGWEEEQSEQARTLIVPLLQTIPVPVFFIMGNDDHVELGPDGERIRSIHGRRLSFGGFSIVGYQYSPPFVGGCHEKPDKEIAADLCGIEPLLDETTILVTHSPAFGYVDQIYAGDHVGSHAISELLQRTNVLCHVHGHIHHSFGHAGKHFNVACGGRRQALIIDVPSLSSQVIEG